MSWINKIINFFRPPTAKRPLPAGKVGDHSGTQERPQNVDLPCSPQQNNANTRVPKSHPHKRSRRDKPLSQEHGHIPHKPKPIPTPIQPSGKEFKDLGIHPKLVELLKLNHFTHATPVQEKSVAPAIAGKNIFCSSETGSGKTLSFLIPMIHKFYTKEINQALILCPTREIAIQIQKAIDAFKDASLTTALVIGGTDIRQQKAELKKYPKILVATPGRLLDMLSSGLIWLQYTGYVVLDEADRMLDMGFEEDLNKIRAELKGEHQVVLFSATLFPEIKKMAHRFADSFEEIVIGNPTSVAGSIEHVLVEMHERDKLTALKFLIKRNHGKSIVFFNTIRETAQVTQQLIRQRVPRIDCIHSKVEQSAREQIIAHFREGKINVLLASDVASRGIDVPNVELVINFDVPNNNEEYIHRVGRTGRAGQKGIAITFYSPGDEKKLSAIEKLIDSKIKRVKDYRGIL